jgi:mono/diheme cytochrome c family protein
MENYKGKIMKKLFILIVISVAWLSSCSPRRTEIFKGELQLNEAEKHGQVLFMQNCQKCHPNGEGGLGPALNTNPAPKMIKALQIRKGLGVMPSFKEHELSKEEVKHISLFLKALKHN